MCPLWLGCPMASKGGARPSAGRPLGRKNAATLEREARLKILLEANNDKLPLDLMLAAMRKADAEGDGDLAFTYAKECAPYLHPKLSATTAKVEQTIEVEVQASDARAKLFTKPIHSAQ